MRKHYTLFTEIKGRTETSSYELDMWGETPSEIIQAAVKLMLYLVDCLDGCKDTGLTCHYVVTDDDSNKICDFTF
ncbi:MAG: hypothetical protein Q4F41_09350 [Eubacteriales bacterium]|nr:hypothetical protein [Eubacteriales bacterium]